MLKYRIPQIVTLTRFISLLLAILPFTFSLLNKTTYSLCNNQKYKSQTLKNQVFGFISCRGSGIRTHDPLLPKQVR